MKIIYTYILILNYHFYHYYNIFVIIIVTIIIINTFIIIITIIRTIIFIIIMIIVPYSVDPESIVVNRTTSAQQVLIRKPTVLYQRNELIKDEHAFRRKATFTDFPSVYLRSPICPPVRAPIAPWRH